MMILSRRWRAAASALRTGGPAEPDVAFGPVNNPTQYASVQRVVADLPRPRARS